MVADGKLIDADALLAQLEQWADQKRDDHKGDTLVSYILAETVRQAWQNSHDQPDASDPLRKRIAELEEALRVNADLVRDYALYDNPTPEQVENGLMMSANVLLKGGQDA